MTVTLAWPEKDNTLEPPMIAALHDAVRLANEDPDTRVLVLAGEGKTFCAGADLAAMSVAMGANASGAGGHGGHGQDTSYRALLLAMVASEVPILARVNGDALAGGLGLVAASTFVIAVEHATLGTPEIDAALFPMMLVSLLGRLVPRRRLNRMMFLNEPMTAAEAAEFGLIDRDVAPVHLDEFVDALVLKIASKSRTAVSHGLRALHAQEELPLESSLPLLEDRLEALLLDADAEAARGA